MPAELLFEPAVFVLFIFIFSPSVSADDFIRVGCCLEFFMIGVFAELALRAQPRSVGVRGRETSAFEMVLSPEAKQDKLMATLKWFLPREKRRIIGRASEA